MAEFYFSVGLTDQIDYDGFVYNTDKEISDPAISYNIRKASTDIEKQSIRWKLNINLPAIKNIILTWEHIIRRPHLNMIHIQTESPTFMPDYESYNLSIDYINLIPLDPAVLSQCQPEDYAALTEDYNLEFGELMLDDFYNYQFQDVDWQHSLLRAYNDDDISDLQLNTIKPIVLPRFRANFQLREYSHTLKHGPSARFTKWVEQNEQELTAKGYIPGTPSCTVGNLPLGKLVGDPWEEFQKLQTYPRICRTSITKTE